MNKILISDLIDDMGINKFTWKFFSLIGIVIFFCGICNMFPAYTMPQIAKEWHLTPVEMGSLSSWGMLGLFFGAIFSGTLSDAIGRKKTAIIVASIFAIFSTLTYFASSFGFFIVVRTITGFGIGALTPAAVALISEYVPSKNRGAFVTGNLAIFIFGWLISGVLGMLIVPAFGWRVLYLIGLVTVPFILLVAAMMPESARWLMSKGREEDAIKEIQKMEKTVKGVANEYAVGSLVVPAPLKVVGVRALVSKEYRKITFMLWFMNFLSLIIIYGITNWMPSLLVAQGFSVVKSYSFSIFQNLAAMVAAFSAGYISDIAGRKKMGIIGYTALAVSVIVFTFVTGEWMVMVFVIIVGFVMNLASSVLQPITAESYPTEFRSTGIAWFQGVGRLGAVVGPLLIGFLSQSGFSFQAILALVAVPALICMLVLAIFYKETKGKAL